MRIAYFDCFSGISGDMTIGAFLDAGLGMERLRRELSKLKIKGYTLKSHKTSRGAFSGTKFDCLATGNKNAHRSLKEIIALIDRSSLNGRVKSTAKDIFTAIGNAEARVHGLGPKSDIRLHELGDIDSIIDIVGTAIAVDALGIDEVYASKISLGRTFVRSAHGVIPIPAPATLELLKGVPASVTDVEAELVTPTGAGILKGLAKGFGRMPELEISRIGYGAGTRDLPDGPNMLRVIIGEAKEAFKTDRIFVIEANIDDMNPQNFEYVFERLFKEGALDVYLSSIIMKKSRPAFKLSVLANSGDVDRLSSVIFRETTTIGVRFYEANRLKLERKFASVDTRYGKVRVKLSGSAHAAFTASPEYDECAKLARKKRVPFRAVYEEAKRLVAR